MEKAVATAMEMKRNLSLHFVGAVVLNPSFKDKALFVMYKDPFCFSFLKIKTKLFFHFSY